MLALVPFLVVVVLKFELATSEFQMLTPICKLLHVRRLTWIGLSYFGGGERYWAWTDVLLLQSLSRVPVQDSSWQPALLFSAGLSVLFAVG